MSKNKYPAILDKYFDFSEMGKEFFEIQVPEKEIINLMDEDGLKIPLDYLELLEFIFRLFKYNIAEPPEPPKDKRPSIQYDEISLIQFITNIKENKIKIDSINFRIRGNKNLIIKTDHNLKKILKCVTEYFEIPKWYNLGAMDLFN